MILASRNSFSTGYSLEYVLAVVGVPILIAAPVLACFVALLSGLDLYEAIAVTYMGGVSNYVLNYFLMFVDLTGLTLCNEQVSGRRSQQAAGAVPGRALLFAGCFDMLEITPEHCQQ